MEKYLKTIIIIIVLTLALSGCTEENGSTTPIDTDGDGYTDDIDAFPTNTTEWKDTDNDGIGDNTDAFPINASEWKDTDDDGIGDNTDYYPNDNTRWKTPQIITISINNTKETITHPTNEIHLIITASNTNITIHPTTPLVELTLTGNNNTIHVSINHTFTMDNTGQNNRFTYYDEVDPIIQQALPYLIKINPNNPDLKNYAEDLISGCSTHNKECHITTIYRHILETYTLLTNLPKNIQTPQETIQNKSGTHTDLTILLTSLLENININTYLGITDNHIYTFIPNLDSTTLWTNCETALISYIENSWGEEIHQTHTESFSIASATARYFGGGDDPLFNQYIETVTFDFTINSNHPLHFYILKTYDDFVNFYQGNPFNHYTEYEKPSTSGILDTITIETYGGILLFNEGLNSADVTINLELDFKPLFYNEYSQESINEYSFDSHTGIILDLSLEEYGFPGNNENIPDPITIISVSTHQHYLLS